MLSGLMPYAAYRQTDVPWFGKVPQHWEVMPLCAVARSKSITGHPKRELLSVYLDWAYSVL